MRGLPRNYLQACLLLLVAESPAHGYDLLEQLRELGFRRTDSGAVYRTLRFLEDDGLVESWWEEPIAGPARRTYRLTDLGAACLQGWAGALVESSCYLSSFLARHEHLKERVRAGGRR